MLHDAVSGERLAATKTEVVAVATAWQGRRFTADDGGAAGPRVSDVLAVVHQDNSRSLALCHRYGLTEELTRPHPAHIRIRHISASGT